MQYKKHPDRLWRHWLSAPFLYMMIIPVVIMDIFLEIYHRICFPLYGIEYAHRSDFIIIDRHRLKYLNLLDKFNCTYCSYANGLMRYGSAIAAETEKYWCGIKHANKELPHQKEFLPYGDEKAYREFCQRKH